MYPFAEAGGNLYPVSDPSQKLSTPVTPVTPITSEGVASLQSLTNRDVASLDEASKKRLQKLLQKSANAATTLFAARALQEQQKLHMAL